MSKKLDGQHKQIHGEEANARGFDSCKQHKKGCPSYDMRIIINKYQYNVKNKHEESDAHILYTDQKIKMLPRQLNFNQFVALGG